MFFIGTMFLASPITQANTPLVCNMHTITGDDDGSFQMLLPFYLKLGQTEYDRVYYSTNATVTFGQPDGTFWDYPQTPSVSIAGRDWVSFGPGAYTSYGYNENSFCIEWSVRPFPQSSGPLTQMRLVVNKFSNGNWHGEIITMTDLPADARRGIRYEYGQPVITMEAAFDVGNGGIPIEVAPAPTPSSFTEPPVVPSETPSPTPEPTPEPTPTATLEPQPSESPTPTIEPSPQPIEPSPVPSEPVVLPSETSSPIPVPSFSSPSEYPWQPEGPVAVPSLDPEPEISYPEPLIPDPIESSFPDLDLPSIDLPSNNVITEITDEEINTFTEITDTEIDTFIEDFTQSGEISDFETEQLIETFLNDGFISEDEVSGLSDSLTEDGILTEDEKELLVDVILEQADGNAISTELINELGLDYEDLPDDQPVMLENGVILFAEVADALEIFENPSEILGAVFTDPGKALTAVANIGTDMTPEKREESQRVVVASVISVQIVAATNLATGRIR
jgi:hypothetical protein